MNRHFPPSFFVANRQKLIEKLRGGAIAMTAYTQQQSTNDIEHAFTQEASFWYLTGIDYADWRVIIDGRRGKCWLVMPTIPPEHIVFGGCLTADEARAMSGIEDIVDSTEALGLLRQLARSHSLVYTCDPPINEHFTFVLNPAARDFRALLERHFTTVQNCRKEIAGLRAIKQPLELTAIKQAVAHTIAGFERVRKDLQNYKFEYEIEADFSHEFRFTGTDGHAYQPIVAAGANACTLHYLHNNDRLKKRSLLLMDVGARYAGYAADITRTYALGEPSKRQQAVHDAVREAQEKIIALSKPGTPLTSYREQSDAIMEDALVEVKLIMPGDTDGFYKYFPHAIGHGLGIDVHDSLGAQQYLQPGMVITVEPGIYIPAEGIGVRIEDDIYISEDGPVNLSQKLSTAAA